MHAPELLWGTTRTTPHGYRGRVHIVRPDNRYAAWCGCIVDEVWPKRPLPRTANTPTICPECAIDYLVRIYPAEAIFSGSNPTA
jgi:hypothetical protein